MISHHWNTRCHVEVIALRQGSSIDNFHALLLFPGHHLVDGLAFDFLADPGFDALVFFFRDLFSDLAVCGVPAEDVRIETGHDDQGGANNVAQNLSKTQHDAAQDHVEDEPPNAVEQETEVDRNDDPQELELSFQTTDQKPPANGVHAQHEGRQR